jgi:uncharacterized repeat protein (TIGR01451 family)
MDKLTEFGQDKANTVIANRRSALAIASAILAILILLILPDVVLGQVPAITIAKTPNTQAVVSGGTANFTILVQNTGDVDLSNVTVSDPNAPDCVATFASIPVGGSETYTCSLANVTAGFTNTASVTATPPTGPDVSDSDTADVSAAAPAIAIVKTTNGEDGPDVLKDAGVTWRYEVTNAGNVPLSNISVSDSDIAVLPTYVSGNTDGDNELDLDETWIYEATGIAGAGLYENTGSASGDFTDDNDNSETVNDSDDSSYFGLDPRLTVEKRANVTLAHAGDVIGYAYTVKNTGNITLGSITLIDDRLGSISLGSTTLGPGDVTSGSQVYTVLAADLPGPLQNTARATGAWVQSSQVTALGVGTESVNLAGIVIEKRTNGQDADTPPGPYIRAGDPVTWRYHVTNMGNVTLTDVRVVDSHLGAVTCDEGPIPDLGPAPLPVNPSTQSTVEVRVAASTDDAEENNATGIMSRASSDLELVVDRSSNQLVGMRFNGVNIPPGANITNAFVQFQADEIGSEATSLIIQGQDIDNAPTFTSATGNISSRSRTTASVSWAPVPWTTIGEAGLAQRTPDITSVVQEIVNRSGWSSGNSLVVIISGTGHRTAESYNGVPAAAPLLHVEFTTEPGNAGESFLCTTSGVAAAGQYTNTGTVTAKDPNNRGLTDSDDSHYFGIRPRLALEKTANVDAAFVGDKITYTYVVTNIGNVSLNSIVLTDDKLGSISLGTTTLAPGISTNGIAEHTVVSSDLPGPLQNTAQVTGKWVMSSEVTATANGFESVVVSPIYYTYLPIIASKGCPGGAGDIGFESGNFSGWDVGGQLGRAISNAAHCGNFAALLGDPGYSCTGVPVGSAWMRASFLVPDTNSPTLTFWYRTLTYDANPGLTNKYDSFDVLVAGSLGFRYANQVDVLSCSTLRDTGWQQKTIDLSAYRGQNATIEFQNHNRHDAFYNTWTYIDDITLEP